MLSRQKELNFPPGERHLYSNSGFTLMAIIVSGTMDSVRRDEMFRTGVRATLRKPYSAAEMLRAVRAVVHVVARCHPAARQRRQRQCHR